MDKFGSMQVGYSMEQLISNELPLDSMQRVVFFKSYFKVSFDELEHCMDVSVLLQGCVESEFVCIRSSNFEGKRSHSSG